MRTLLLALLTVGTVPFVVAWLSPDEYSLRRTTIRSIVSARTTALRTQGGSFDAACIRANKSTDLTSLRASYENLRATYKSMEPLLEYLDPGTISQYINGAPLPRLDAKSQFVDVLEPQGLQVIDELLFEDDTLTSSELLELRDLSAALRT